MPCKKSIFISPIRYPHNIIAQYRPLSIVLKYFNELIDPEQILMHECYPQKLEIAEIWKGLNAIPGKIQLD